MKIEITIPNLKATLNKIKVGAAIKQKRIREVVIKTGLKIQRGARVNQTPHVDTGILRASIDMSVSLADPNVTEVMVFSKVKYAGYHEAAYPYLTPAALEARRSFLQSVSQVMSQ